jgi:uroporphyrinogen decarboxylase
MMGGDSMTIPAENRKELLLRACRCEAVERVPVWIMRQAGRYLPEYQAVRKHHSFLEICKTPALAAEVSIQPLRAIDVDAVIVFSDILIVAEAMGMHLEVPDSGPVLEHPIRDRAGLDRLRDFDPDSDTRFVGDAIREIVREVGPTIPVIGFAAAPWTLACYMIEGQTRGKIGTAIEMARTQPHLMRDLLEKIARSTAAYLRSQIAAGAAVVQLFDTWAGELTGEEFDALELPAIQSLLSELNAAPTPVIYFARGASHLVESAGRTGANVISVDWRTDLAAARRVLGPRIALQGNVDPAILLESPEAAAEAARHAVQATGGAGHILNLGHGILPTTPVENARAFVAAGKTMRASAATARSRPLDAAV